MFGVEQRYVSVQHFKETNQIDKCIKMTLSGNKEIGTLLSGKLFSDLRVLKQFQTSNTQGTAYASGAFHCRWARAIRFPPILLLWKILSSIHFPVIIIHMWKLFFQFDVYYCSVIMCRWLAKLLMFIFWIFLPWFLRSIIALCANSNQLFLFQQTPLLA